MPKISELTAGDAPDGTELVPVVQDGETRRLPLSQIGAPVSRQIVTGSSDTIAAATTHLVINRSGPSATGLTLPNLATWSGSRLAIIDFSQSVTEHTITLTPAAAAQKVMRQSTWTLLSNAANLASVSLERIVDPDDSSNYVWIIAP